MSFSEYSGTAIVPTLARLVLAGVFITAGYAKCFKDMEYQGDDAQRLRDIEFVEPAAQPTAMNRGVSGIEVVPVSYVQDGAGGAGQDDTQDDDQDTGGGDSGQDAPPTGGDQDTGGDDAGQDTGDDDTGQDAPPTGDQATGDDAAAGQDQPEELVTPADAPVPATGSITAKQAGMVALAVDKHGWPQPKLMAWVASLTELVGGALILLGLFSRLWGAGLAIVMGVAFYFTSWAPLTDVNFNLFALMETNFQAFSTMFFQLSLLVLALLVLFAGPGPLSIDRLLFGKAKPSPEEEF